MDLILGCFLKRNRFMMFLLASIVAFGTYAYFTLPRERTPTIKVPVISIVAVVDGISEEKAEKLLVSPIEKEVQAVSGVKKVISVAKDGSATVVLKFSHGTDMRAAMEDVRTKLDLARSELPRELKSLIAKEVDLGAAPVLHVAVAGDVQGAILSKVARSLKSSIESLGGVLSVEAEGLQEYVVEINFFPELLNHYGIQVQDIQRAITGSYSFVEYGVMESEIGRHKVKLTGELDSYKKIQDLVLKAKGDEFVTISDVAKVNFTEKAVSEFVRVDGKAAVVLKVSKKSGSDITEVVGKIKNILDEASSLLPSNVALIFLQDQSQEVKYVLHELENTLVFSVVLVLLVMMVFMGFRTAILVAVAIPVSALLGVSVIYIMGYTLNIVILFTLIMVIGMLVDDAIVVSEYADRKMAHGMDRVFAYKSAAVAMFWPIAAATATRLAVFIPLLFWPGVTGEFIKYIPVVSISTLVGSWIVALIFTPVLGSMFGKVSAVSPEEVKRINAIEDLDFDSLGKCTRFYAKVLFVVLDHPRKFVCIVTSVLVLSTVMYFSFGPGVEFFPDVEPDRALIIAKSDNNLSVGERDLIILDVEEKIRNIAGVRHIYTRSVEKWGDASSGVVGVIGIEFFDWFLREKSSKILRDILHRIKGVKGVFFDVEYESMKPSRGKQIEISLRADNKVLLNDAASVLEKAMSASQGFVGVSKDTLTSGYEWILDVDRKRARASGVDVYLIGQYIKLLTDGLVVGKYYPSDFDDGIDIIARFNEKHRSLKGIDSLQINTHYGTVPVSYFMNRKARAAAGSIKRVNGMRSMTISSYIAPGMYVSERVGYIKSALQGAVDPSVEVSFLGDMEDQEESKAFLIKAFAMVLVMISLVLMCELNSFYYVFVVMTAVFLSTTCVFFGFLLTYKVFGVVMGGVGIIVLAGVVVNNNILLIDAFRSNVDSSLSRKEAIMKSALSRLRPIFLTVITGVLGLMPMVLRLSVDFIYGRILYDSPASQLWFELSTTTSMGLLLATIVTLLYTPAVLMCHKVGTEKRSDDYATLGLSR
ncbi:efflux RND transporter permease subunit [Candidatus Anaplasma sp. TIGMIC]|uniref:efflux RND transporter permease subunit n=1 Tax=Candidatus Anaplasma sp. TIGMIC TaxID=3020713 RepID=UPI00232B1332|nr:efflux RND transporter permease subunit [Candidatus Anaplasma sp. TIGMIC]MDB1135163.1 efflux RND transporter permease subunit [Candidatus Anaplasma sp. TIGMIC]